MSGDKKPAPRTSNAEMLARLRQIFGMAPYTEAEWIALGGEPRATKDIEVPNV